MGDSVQLLEILGFAVIAAVLVFRLYTILGRRTGNERRRDLPFGRPPAPGSSAPQPAPFALPQQPRLAAVAPAPPVDPVLAPLLAADPSFDRAAFLKGARGAFEIIVEAFAAGDRAKLQPLLSPEVFKGFSEVIEAHERAGEKLETKVVAIESADITEARLEGETALLTIAFVSDQILVTRNAAGAVIDGDPDHPTKQTDIWTFARPLRARDPNWALVATRSGEAQA